MNDPYIVLCLNARQQAQNAAWQAWLANTPMTWITR
jgi:hypothetical protein